VAGGGADFWVLWLEPGHRVGLFGLVINSAVLIYVSGFPFFFVGVANRLRKVNPEISVPLLRVAFVVTRAPSEPWEVVRSTLTAMLEQDFPFGYDVWLCDEQPTEEYFDWCVDRDVKIATRNAEERYHRQTWPRRTRCKEGNLAYFYDRWGYRYYDVVAQLDCDHRPAPTYLAEMVRPFSDPAIGYVAAPSVCDVNAESSWAARGRLHREATFHGPMQLGHNDGLAPLCIGSHYAVRTQALRDIGGLGPELAEDFSTTFLLNVAGWQGAFAINAEAHGDGPNTFGAMLVQEFQWSRSLTTVLLGLVPQHMRHLPRQLRLRFLYALSYYVLLASTTLTGALLAPIAAATGLPWINVNYLTFLAHWWSISICLVLTVLLLRRQGLWRPRGAPLISWENWLYALARWPYVARGIGAALMNLVRPRPVTFKVTPKGASGLEPLPARIMAPYFALAAGSAAAALLGERSQSVPGYVFLSIAGAVTYSLVLGLVPLLHAKESAAAAEVPFGRALRATVAGPAGLAVIAFALTAAAITFFPALFVHAFGFAPWSGAHQIRFPGFGPRPFG
jgi:cellulose synthase/poly-beta-1,6-N-acetylglucosamine synthase-like glycosyltransferase